MEGRRTDGRGLYVSPLQPTVRMRMIRGLEDDDEERAREESERRERERGCASHHATMLPSLAVRPSHRFKTFAKEETTSHPNRSFQTG